MGKKKKEKDKKDETPEQKEKKVSKKYAGVLGALFVLLAFVVSGIFIILGNVILLIGMGLIALAAVIKVKSDEPHEQAIIFLMTLIVGIFVINGIVNDWPVYFAVKDFFGWEIIYTGRLECMP